MGDNSTFWLEAVPNVLFPLDWGSRRFQAATLKTEGRGIPFQLMVATAVPPAPRQRRCEMDLSEHTAMMGRLLVSFQCLEYALRTFLYERHDPPHEPLAPGIDLNSMNFGDVVPENAITRWDSLMHLIKRYNRAVGHGELAVDPGLVDLRDALAHGRMAASLSEGNFALIKFTRPYAGRVEVGFREKLSKEWLENQIKRVLAGCEKVGRAASSRR